MFNQKHPEKFLKNLPTRPGVYQMLDEGGEILYVGKAKNIRKRVRSYFRSNVDIKTQALISQVNNIEVIIAPSENEALLLENNLIKTLRPKYNIIFKDDKSYLYVLLTEHDYPAIKIHRGAKNIKGKYFGPYPKGRVVYDTLNLLQKVFKLRVCNDQIFATRSRPCLQYQIKRCTAPCVKAIDQYSYNKDVKFAELFLKGNNDLIIEELSNLMSQAAKELDFEKALFYRDQIRNLRDISSQQVMIKDKGNIDVIAYVSEKMQLAINVLFVRMGHVIGSKNYYPKIPEFSETSEILGNFLVQLYLNETPEREYPTEILVNQKISDKKCVEETLTQIFHKKVRIYDNVKKDRKKLIELAKTNALYALSSRNKILSNVGEKIIDLKKQLGLGRIPKLIEGFDVSHTGGESTVVSCVVFDNNGPLKKEYRKFNIKSAGVSDDYAALKEALTRRYKSVDKIPDVILIDGGKGQLNVASEVIAKLLASSHCDKNINYKIVAIAKGEGRKPGAEKIFLENMHVALAISPKTPAFYLLQQIRDEAHRFAVAGHRRRMAKSKSTSILEKIPGIGGMRRKNLLIHFGGLQGLEQAKIEDIAKVKGINNDLAKIIYEYLHK